MSRTLNSPVGDQRGELVYLYELEYSSGTLYLTNSSADISWNGNTYVALGGQTLHQEVSEIHDRQAQGVRMTLFAVNQSIISTILQHDFRNRVAKIYLVHFDPDTGVMDTPDLIWSGRQHGDYQIEEEIGEEQSTARITTRIASAMAMLEHPRSVRANVTSHNEMLKRAGVTTGDNFFKFLPAIQGKPFMWGSETPAAGGVSPDGYTGRGETKGGAKGRG